MISADDKELNEDITPPQPMPLAPRKASLLFFIGTRKDQRRYDVR